MKRLITKEAAPSFLANCSIQEAEDWLEKHPQATVQIGNWMVTIESPDFKDTDHEANDRPFWFEGATESFHKSANENGKWFCCWCVF